MAEMQNTWGGKREGAGRPKGWRKETSIQRKQHQVRAFDDEWSLIKEFMILCRKDIDSCRESVEALKRRVDGMKVEIRYYPKAEGAIVPELKELREETFVKDRAEVIEMAKEMELPPVADYAHIFLNGIEDVSIAVLSNGGIRDMESGDWIVEEPDED